MSKFIDLTGQIFNKLMVIDLENYIKNGKSTWSCLCDCNNKTIVVGSDLKNGHTKSCGCLKKKNKGAPLKHGHSKNSKQSRAYQRWVSMNQRCNNKNHKYYKDYGGRNPPITVCRRWSNKNPHGFENFYKDVGDAPKGKSLDRINNNKGYYPNNWQWATPKEQANNRRNNLSKRSLILRKYERRLRNCLANLRSKNNNKIIYSKYLQYNSKQLNDHLENIRSLQNNYCPMCNKSYNEIKYDIDHIVPTSSVKTKDELLQFFLLENLSLLCFYCNRYIKRNRIIRGNSYYAR